MKLIQNKTLVFFSNSVCLFNLDAACQHLIEDVSPLFHDADVVQCGVSTLTVLDGVNKAIPELLH